MSAGRAMLRRMAKVNFYIDGLNLYYGLLKQRPHLKWLNLRAWCESLTTDHEIHRVHYFTARIKGTAGDPKAPERQDAYLRALRTVGGVEIHTGHFIREASSMLRVDGKGKIDVWKIEEKCSDVNIGSHMFLDAVQDDCEVFALITNDADLRMPVRMLTGPPFHREVWVFNPTPRPKCNHFKPTIHLNLRVEPLEAAQLPELVRRQRGEPIRRPVEWR